MPVGRVETGILKVGMDVVFAPVNIKREVKSLEIFNEYSIQAVAGDTVGFNISALIKKDLRRGYVCGSAKNDPPKEVESFLAQILILNHPGKIEVGYTPVVHCHTAHIACRFDEIQTKIDRTTGNATENWPKYIIKGDSALVLLKPIKPMCV